MAVGDTRKEVERSNCEALAMHLQAMLDDHDPIPPAVSDATYVEVSLRRPVA
ncbi:MAG: hypothetical protein ABI068_14455 [Ktedonobacterales bacterium]